MKKALLCVFLLLGCLTSRATHIVGGDIDLQRISDQGFTHRLSLNLYFDAINGQPGALDQTVTLGFFRKKDNVMMGYVVVPLISNLQIPYTNPDCSEYGNVRTRLIKYSSLVTLASANFNDPEGYYIAWDRCCRNDVISNIQNPGRTSSLFYTEFPAILVDNKEFINSTPKFKDLSGDYICINRPFNFDFSATDADGDSLVYSVVSPLAGFSSVQSPNPQFPTGSSNYPRVTWATGYSNTNAIPGNPALSVNSRTGRLSVTANQLGLFVFSVRVEEYRAGKRIGYALRDFQLKVVDCPINNAPISFAKLKGSLNKIGKDEIITIPNTQKNACFELYFTDPNPYTQIRLKVVGQNFSDKGFANIPIAYNILSKADTLKAEICLDECSQSFDGKPLVFQVFTSDNGCPQSLSDTLTVRVYRQPRDNAKPIISTDAISRTLSAPINSSLSYNIFGKDVDVDSLSLRAVGRGFTLSQAGITFNGGSGIGNVQSPFTWKPLCDQIRTTDYLVDFIVSDRYCSRSKSDTLTIAFKPTPILSNKPRVSTTLKDQNITVVLDGENAIPLTFDVNAKDPDSDPIQLYGIGQGFNLGSVGISWSNKNGIASLTSPFQWNLTCELLGQEKEKTFVINFVTEDNSCSPMRFDTTKVTVLVKNKENAYTFTPPNVITPNGDGKNDSFTITNLPENSCFDRFEYIQVFNRWGQQVYQSYDRKFEWFADEIVSGDYYYLLKFTRQNFKGWISVLK
ncbi:T9SS type B sorting domain-containing protein [Emticicia sp. ODNR4P]|nr:T9SS type B sorting domain-containing protein [Emticicia sp. ODNR4P]